MSVTAPTLGRRVAAVLALALVATATLLLIWLVTNATFTSVVVILIAQAVGLGALWVAVSRRGWRAWSALGVVVVAQVVTLLAIQDLGDLWKVLAFIAIWPVAAAAARRALRMDKPSLVAAALSGDPVAACPRPTLIMNPWSGGGKVGRFDLPAVCRERGVEPVALQEGDDIVQLALDAVAAGADALGAAGGDGTQALVATVAAEHDLPFVCIPAGTRNHFALDLGLDRDDVVGSLDAFGDAVERRVDLARVNGRTFVNNCSLGLYARIVQSDEYRDAKIKTATAMLPDLLGPDGESLDLRFTDGRGEARSTTQMLLVSNNPYELDRLGGFGTRARMDSAELGLVDVHIGGRADFRAFVALQAAGRVRDFPGWGEWSSPRFELDSAGPIEVGVDGEALRMDPPLVFESWPAALRVRLPHHAPGRAPAAVAVNLDLPTLRRLAAVAGGRAEQ